MVSMRCFGRSHPYASEWVSPTPGCALDSPLQHAGSVERRSSALVLVSALQEARMPPRLTKRTPTLAGHRLEGVQQQIRDTAGRCLRHLDRLALSGSDVDERCP